MDRQLGDIDSVAFSPDGDKVEHELTFRSQNGGQNVQQYSSTQDNLDGRLLNLLRTRFKLCFWTLIALSCANIVLFLVNFCMLLISVNIEIPIPNSIQSAQPSALPEIISACPSGWKVFLDLHCYRIFNQHQTHTYEEAEAICAEQGATLAVVRFRKQQYFLANFLFNESQVFDNVWLGARIGSERKFHWQDGSELSFTNWIEGSPKLVADHCVQVLDSANLFLTN